MRERDCAARLFVCARLIIMRRALYWICPRYVILGGHFSKRDQKESHQKPQRRKKRRKNLTLSSFPDLSSFFIEDTFIYRSSSSSSSERERKKDRGERETKCENSRASRETTTLKRRFEEKRVGFLF